jgi:hypothetical protein
LKQKSIEFDALTLVISELEKNYEVTNSNLQKEIKETRESLKNLSEEHVWMQSIDIVFCLTLQDLLMKEKEERIETFTRRITFLEEANHNLEAVCIYKL